MLGQGRSGCRVIGLRCPECLLLPCGGGYRRQRPRRETRELRVIPMEKSPLPDWLAMADKMLDDAILRPELWARGRRKRDDDKGVDRG